MYTTTRRPLSGIGFCLLVFAVMTPQVEAAEPSDLRERYRIVVSDDVYPQDTPKATIRSIIDAIENSNARYALAHLISPAQVDQRLRGNAREFEKLVSGMTPAKSRQLLQRLEDHLIDGDWNTRHRSAWSRLEGLPDLTLERIGERWFMHNVPRTPQRQARSR